MATERETIFELETEEDGGPLRLYEVPPIFQELRMTYAIESARLLKNSKDRPGSNGPLKYIFPALVDNLSIDAFISKKDGEHYIGIFAGGYLVMLDVFYTMLSHPKILLDIGDVSKEQFNGPMPTDGFDISLGHFDNLSATISKRFYQNIPKDPERKRYAETMARIAFDFLFYHEIAHVMAGHHEFLYSSNSKIKFRESEIINFYEPISDYRCRDILEYDADRISAKYILQFFSRALNLNDTSERGTKRIWDVFRAIHFSIFSLFRLLAIETPHFSNYKSMNYPHPDIRYFLTAVVFREAAQATSENTNIIVEGTMKRSLQDIMDSWEILDLPNQFAFEKESFDDLCIDVINRLDQRQVELSKYSYCRDIKRWSTILGKYV